MRLHTVKQPHVDHMVSTIYYNYKSKYFLRAHNNLNDKLIL